MCPISQETKKTLLIVVNKIDQVKPNEEFLTSIREASVEIIFVSSVDPALRDLQINALKQALIRLCPKGFFNGPALLGTFCHPAVWW